MSFIRPTLAVVLPAFAQGLAVNGWVELTSAALSSAAVMTAPGGSNYPQGKQNAWNSHVYDHVRKHALSVGEGGHDDYWGNEVDRLLMTADAPSWAELLASTVSANVTTASAYYSDGNPASIHGYYCPHYISRLDKVLRFPGGARSKDGGAMQDITAYNCSTAAWEGSGTWSGSGPGGSSFNTGDTAWAKHPTTEDVYGWQANTRILKWTNTGTIGSWSTLVTFPANPAVLDTAAAIDPTRGTAGMMYCLGGGSSAFSRRVTLSDGTIDTITLTGTDLTGESAPGMFYCSVTDKFYVCILAPSGGSSVYTITPTSGTSWACAALSTTGGSGIPSTTGNSQGPRNKWLYIPDIGGGVGGALWSPKWTANSWFLRLH